MQFNGDANNNDIVSDIDYWAGTDVNSYPLIDKARNSNLALDRTVALIMRSDQKWEWDDQNNVDLPIAVTDLVAGQQDYSISITHLKIVKVRIKDATGKWISLDPVDRRDVTDSQFQEGSGDPRRYDKVGNSFFLYPASSHSSAGGFEVQFQRPPSYFVPGDTTKTPGFASIFHRLVSLGAAADYCAAHGLDSRLAKINAKIADIEAELIVFYATRNRDEKQSLSLQDEDYGQLGLAQDGRRSGHPDKFF